MHLPVCLPPPPAFARLRLRSYRLPLISSADGAFNAALLLERGDPLSAVAMAAGLPMFQEHRYRAPSPSHLPLQQSNGAGAGPATTTAPPPPPPAGSISTNCGNLDIPAAALSRENATGSSQQNIDGSCVETTTTTGEGGERQFEPDFLSSDLGEHASGIVDQIHQRRDDKHSSSCKTGARQQQEHRAGTAGGNPSLWGSRPLALQMFQRAAELGHPEAMREVQRLRLRERMEP